MSEDLQEAGEAVLTVAARVIRRGPRVAPGPKVCAVTRLRGRTAAAGSSQQSLAEKLGRVMSATRLEIGPQLAGGVVPKALYITGQHFPPKTFR